MLGASDFQFSTAHAAGHPCWLPIASRFVAATDRLQTLRAKAQMGVMGDRLPKLIDNAANLRRLAGQYRKEARALLHRARLVRSGNIEGSIDIDDVLFQVQQARRKASKCDSFAMMCERRAETMATLAGFLLANSSTTH